MKRTPLFCFWLSALLSVSLFAQEPNPPVPVPPKPQASIVASKEVSGTGKREDPFIFTSSTKCILKLSEAVKEVKWDVDNCPQGTEIIAEQIIVFDLHSKGEFTTTAYGPIYSKVWFVIKSGTDPPTPGPTPPGPTPNPVDPDSVGLLRVLILTPNSTKVLTSPQQAAINSTLVSAYCKTHCAKGNDGKTLEYKQYEPDTDVSAESPEIQELYKTAVNESKGILPWLVITNGKTGYSGPYPASPTATENVNAVLGLLQKYGGK